jgi:protein involved in polysaccharide export with SLBB domain
MAFVMTPRLRQPRCAAPAARAARSGTTRVAAGCALVLLSLVGVLPAAAQAPALRGEATTASGARLAPGDIVRIDVWGRPELSGEFLVGADSAISHPLFQQLRVAYLPMPEVATRVRTLLEQLGEGNPRVRIEPRFRVAVTGEVRQPNLYSFGPETTLTQAVALAGGPTERGRLDRVLLVRDGTAQTVDLLTPDDAAGAAPIHSGDRIVVQRRTSVFRDIVVPASTMVGTVASLVNIYIRTR